MGEAVKPRVAPQWSRAPQGQGVCAWCRRSLPLAPGSHGICSRCRPVDKVLTARVLASIFALVFLLALGGCEPEPVEQTDPSWRVWLDADGEVSRMLHEPCDTASALNEFREMDGSGAVTFHAICREGRWLTLVDDSPEPAEGVAL